eukprot:3857009-Pleurochrysis_carterae.AAC.1
MMFNKNPNFIVCAQISNIDDTYTVKEVIRPSLISQAAHTIWRLSVTFAKENQFDARPAKIC